jgi:hypothetical protein
MGQGANHGNGGKVESVPGGALECPDPPLAENDVGIAFREDVLGGEEPFLDGRGHAAFQKDGVGNATEFAKKVEVLHVPCPDLETVDHARHRLDLANIHHLADDPQTGDRAGFAEPLEGFFAVALEGIRGGPGLEGAAAEQMSARVLDRAGNPQQMIVTLDRAGTGDHHGLPTADHDAADGNLGGFRLGVARGFHEK